MGAVLARAANVTGGLALLLAAVLAIGCGSNHASTTSPTPIAGSTPPPAGAPPLRVLMLTATAGFRHDSIGPARQTMTALAASTSAFVVTATEDLGDLSADRLSAFDVVMFALTSGELPLDAGQKTSLIEFVNRGGGFIGIHSASDTLYDFPDYGRLVGAYFKEHPWTQEAAIAVEDPSHPATANLGSKFRLFDEIYTFRDNPRPAVHVLLSLDAASVGAAGDYPLAWSHPFGSGRAYYNALGHFSSTWADARFQSQLIGAIEWAGRR
jgi:type 1 glutamine amidotransferase